MQKISLKTDQDLQKMVEGGQRLNHIKAKLKDLVKEGNRADQIEALAVELIAAAGGKPSFKMVPGYHWATCVNVNSGLVHGVPTKKIVFKKGDVVSVDIGMYYRGFHTDTSFSLGIEPTDREKDFLEAGKRALRLAIKEARPGQRIFDISKAIEDTITRAGFSPIRALVGHGVGKALHEEPQIPCFTHGTREESSEIVAGMGLAIEVMYAQGSDEVELGRDGWTISMRDGKIAALFEETVAVRPSGPLVLT